MTAVCALTLAVAVAVRSAGRRAGAGVAAWIVLVLGHGAPTARQAQAAGDAPRHCHPALTDANLYLPYLAVAACCAAIVGFITRPQRGLQ